MTWQSLGVPTRTLSDGTSRSYVRFVALGDSATLGVGDRVADGWRGWARLLADSVANGHDVSFCNLSASGATVADVRSLQLGKAVEHRPHLASLVVGLNDVLRSDWDPRRFRSDVNHCAARLTDQGAVLITLRYHDHSRVFGLPGFAARPMRRRIDALNEIYDELRGRYGGLHVDLGAHPRVYDRAFWSVDRLHPSELGHRAVAQECATQLEQYGLVFQPPALQLDGEPTTTMGELLRLATEGLPWLARRARDLARWVASNAIRSALGMAVSIHPALRDGAPTQGQRGIGHGPARLEQSQVPTP